MLRPNAGLRHIFHYILREFSACKQGDTASANGGRLLHDWRDTLDRAGTRTLAQNRGLLAWGQEFTRIFMGERIQHGFQGFG
jgi:hypothetical protein